MVAVDRRCVGGCSGVERDRCTGGSAAVERVRGCLVVLAMEHLYCLSFSVLCYLSLVLY